MENTNPTPILQLRQDDVVAIPLERYEELIACETRLTILQQSRIREIITTSYQSIVDRDFILGKPVMDEWELKQAVERGNA